MVTFPQSTSVTLLLNTTSQKGPHIIDKSRKKKITQILEHREISFLIPSGKGDIVVGRLGNFSKTGHSYDGDFQSRELFQWYQKYSHRWLEAGSKERDEEMRRWGDGEQWAVSSGLETGNWGLETDD
jgi:hypothetical protein